MTQTIFDTMTNANGLFYTEMKELKEKDSSIEKTNDAKEPLLNKLSRDEESFEAFKQIVLAMYNLNDIANYATNDQYATRWLEMKRDYTQKC